MRMPPPFHYLHHFKASLLAHAGVDLHTISRYSQHHTHERALRAHQGCKAEGGTEQDIREMMVGSASFELATYRV
jgi:hypothetical protein